jgi:uncharacterized membrane protein YeaQ/YmgE (transglycosylase-associated protein family)
LFFILALVLIPLVAGFVANMVVGKNAHFQNWELFVAGIIGSFVGGTILNLLVNGDFDISISGLLGSILGAIIVLAVWAWLRVKVIKTQRPG